MFGFLNLGPWDLFVICYLVLVIFIVIEWTHKRKNSHYISMIR
ncbi:hypothetical protein D1AOALGA4SA_9467 [Olavius algarvensis Delta 1 endosymbiont]|nr:hypothetical protein D1AOALGA4SA_9467 [Olavius algarvensis Delta 1 endosymbiont]